MPSELMNRPTAPVWSIEPTRGLEIRVTGRFQIIISQRDEFGRTQSIIIDQCNLELVADQLKDAAVQLQSLRRAS